GIRGVTGLAADRGARARALLRGRGHAARVPADARAVRGRGRRAVAYRRAAATAVARRVGRRARAAQGHAGGAVVAVAARLAEQRAGEPPREGGGQGGPQARDSVPLCAVGPIVGRAHRRRGAVAQDAQGHRRQPDRGAAAAAGPHNEGAGGAGHVGVGRRRAAGFRGPDPGAAPARGRRGGPAAGHDGLAVRAPRGAGPRGARQHGPGPREQPDPGRAFGQPLAALVRVLGLGAVAVVRPHPPRGQPGDHLQARRAHRVAQAARDPVLRRRAAPRARRRVGPPAGAGPARLLARRGRLVRGFFQGAAQADPAAHGKHHLDPLGRAGAADGAAAPLAVPGPPPPAAGKGRQLPGKRRGTRRAQRDRARRRGPRRAGAHRRQAAVALPGHGAARIHHAPGDLPRAHAVRPRPGGPPRAGRHARRRRGAGPLRGAVPAPAHGGARGVLRRAGGQGGPPLALGNLPRGAPGRAQGVSGRGKCVVRRGGQAAGAQEEAQGRFLRAVRLVRGRQGAVGA
ncbi:hypothetical protein DFJ74DRAFT_772515, partial [Hyaloraphidium curvatum]